MGSWRLAVDGAAEEAGKDGGDRQGSLCSSLSVCLSGGERAALAPERVRVAAMTRAWCRPNTAGSPSNKGFPSLYWRLCSTAILLLQKIVPRLARSHGNRVRTRPPEIISPLRSPRRISSSCEREGAEGGTRGAVLCCLRGLERSAQVSHAQLWHSLIPEAKRGKPDVSADSSPSLARFVKFGSLFDKLALTHLIPPASPPRTLRLTHQHSHPPG